jgi:hypothetical protein
MERSSGYTATRSVLMTFSALCKKMSKLIDTYTVRELLIEMETLTHIRFLRKVWSDAHRGYKAPEIAHGVLRD